MTELNGHGVFEAAYETRLIIERLKTTEIGDVVKWSEIEGIASRPLAAIRGYIGSARRALIDENIVFDVVRGEGLKRMSDIDIAQSGENARRRTRNLVKRTLKTHGAIAKFDALPEDAKYAAMVTQTWGAAVLHAASNKAVRAIEAAVKKDNSQLVIAKTLEALKSV